MARREVDEIASDLISLYKEKFGGKPLGRYKISKENLRSLSVRLNIQYEGFIVPLSNELFNNGYSLIVIYEEGSESYVIISNDIFKNYREVPLRLIRKYSNAAAEKMEED